MQYSSAAPLRRLAASMTPLWYVYWLCLLFGSFIQSTYCFVRIYALESLAFGALISVPEQGDGNFLMAQQTGNLATSVLAPGFGITAHDDVGAIEFREGGKPAWFFLPCVKLT